MFTQLSEFKLIAVPFNSKIIKQNVSLKFSTFLHSIIFFQRILCIFEADKIHNLAIIFRSVTACDKVYDAVSEIPMCAENEWKQMFLQKFMKPLCNQLSDNPDSHAFFNNLLNEIVSNFYEGKEKEDFQDFLKSRKLDCLIPEDKNAILPDAAASEQVARPENEK